MKFGQGDYVIHRITRHRVRGRGKIVAVYESKGIIRYSFFNDADKELYEFDQKLFDSMYELDIQRCRYDKLKTILQ